MVKIKTVTQRVIENPFEISDFLVWYFGDDIVHTENDRDGTIYLPQKDDYMIRINPDSICFALECPELWSVEVILTLSLEELENMSLDDVASKIREAKEQHKAQQPEDD